MQPVNDSARLKVQYLQTSPINSIGVYDAAPVVIFYDPPQQRAILDRCGKIAWWKRDLG
jgi:hypothetical protein